MPIIYPYTTFITNSPTCIASTTTYTSSSTMSTYTDQVWGYWTSTASTTTVPTQIIWSNWVADCTPSVFNNQQMQQAQLISNPYQNGLSGSGGLTSPATAEDIRVAQEAMRQERERQAAIHKEAQEKRVAAEAKAKDLLNEYLTPIQREAMAKHGWFIVEGGKSKKQYRIRTNAGAAGNITELGKDNKEVARYCVHAAYSLPLADEFLAQAISLRLDEEHLIKTANRTALAA